MISFSIKEIAEAVGGELNGPADMVITGVAGVEDAVSGDVVLAESDKYLRQAERSDASAVVVGVGLVSSKPTIVVDDPKAAFVKILGFFAPPLMSQNPGVDPGARIGERLVLGRDASIGFGCCVGNDVEIGDGAVVHPLSYIGDGVKIGAGSVIYPNVTIRERCELGNRVIVHSGTVIGSDGFGYVPIKGKIVKVPQIGTVVIEDDVEIGSNVTIDRAKTGVTRIGRGTKIDNLVQIAHNVRTGQMCIIVAQVGISGSVEIGNGVTIAGKAGVKDHVKIEDGVIVAGGAEVHGDLKAGGTYLGVPARPYSQAMRAQAAVLRLAETQKTVEKLKKDMELLKKRLELLDGDNK